MPKFWRPKKRERIALRLDGDMLRWLARASRRERKTVSGVVRALVRRAMKRDLKKP